MPIEPTGTLIKPAYPVKKPFFPDPSGFEIMKILPMIVIVSMPLRA